MFLSKLHKNGILTGVIDHLCLLCEEPFRCLNKLQDHIKEPSHLENQKKFGYSKTDLVRKVKTGYFCEACNSRIQSLAKVAIHASDEGHLANKELVQEEAELDELSTLLKYECNDVVFGSVLVKEDAWNSMVEGSCLVCDCEDEDHITTLNHISKLIKCKPQVFNKNYLYRLIDNNSFQCLTCNSLYPSDKFLSHFETPAHKLAYAKCKISNVSKIKAIVSETESAKKDDTSCAKSETTKNEDKPQKETEKSKTGPAPKLDKKTKLDDNLKGNKSSEKVKTDSKKGDPASTLLKSLNENSKVSDTKPSDKKDSVKKDEVTKGNADTDKIQYPSFFDNYESEVEANCRKLGMKDCISVAERSRPICMLCNAEISDARSHLATKHHNMLLIMERKMTFEKKYLKGQKDTKSAKKESSETPLAAKEDESEQPENKNRRAIAKAIFEYQQSAVVIDLISGTANCKKCSVNVEFDPKSIEEHMKTHKSVATEAQNAQSKEKPQEKFELQSYCKENNIHYSPAENHLFCRVCNSKVPKCENNIKDHVKGAKHKMNVAKCQNTNPVKPIATKTKNAQTKEKRPVKFELQSYCKENNIHDSSAENHLFCRVCNSKVPKCENNIKDHVKGAKHKTNVAKCRNTTQVKPIATKTRNAQTKEKQPVKFELQSYCKENNIHYAPAENHLFCEVCNSKVLKYENNIKDHVKDAKHKTNVAKCQNTTPVKPIATKTKNAQTKEKQPVKFELQSYCKENKIHYSPAENHLFCRVCNSKVPKCENNIKDHVKGAKHKTNVAKCQNTTPVKPIATKTKNAQTKEKQPVKFELQSYCKENNIHYSPAENHLFCRVCNSKVPKCENNIKDHVKGAKHKMNVAKCQNTNPVKPIATKTKNAQTKEKRPVKFELQSYCKENNIHDSSAENHLFCRVCNSKMPKCENNIKDHVKGAKHKTNVAKCRNTTQVKPITTKTKNAQTKEKQPVKFELQSYCKENNIHYSSAENHLFCRVCNSKVPKCENNIKDHVKGAKHKTNVAKCRNTTQVKPIATKTRNAQTKEKQPVKFELQSYCKENNIHYSPAENHLFCEVCNSKVLKYENNIKDHVKGAKHKTNVAKCQNTTPVKPIATKTKNAQTKEKQPVKFELQSYCKENKIHYSPAENHLFCRVCNSKVPKCENNIKDHVKGAKHKTNVAKCQNTTPVKPIATKTKNAQTKEKQPVKFELQSYCKENNIHYSPAENHLFCRVCNSKVPNCENNIKDHVKGAKHKANVAKCQNTTQVKPFATKAKNDQSKEKQPVNIFVTENEFEYRFSQNKFK